MRIPILPVAVVVFLVQLQGASAQPTRWTKAADALAERIAADIRRSWRIAPDTIGTRARRSAPMCGTGLYPRQLPTRLPFRPFEAATPERLAALISRLPSEDEAVRWDVLDTLRMMGPTAISAAPALTTTLVSRRAERRLAAETLLRTGAPLDDAMHGLVGLLDAGDAEETKSAAGALGVFWFRARAAGKALARAASHVDPSVRAAALDAYGRLGSVDRAPAVRALGDPVPVVQAAALQALRRLAPLDPAHLPRIVEWAGKGDLARRLVALGALGDLGGTAAPGFAALVAALSDENPVIATAALRAVERIGYPARSLMPAVMRHALKHTAGWETAGRMLDRYGDVQVVPGILRLAERKDWHPRGQASFGQVCLTIRCRDQRAEALLRAARRSENHQVAAVAKGALITSNRPLPARSDRLWSARHAIRPDRSLLRILCAELASADPELASGAALDLAEVGHGRGGHNTEAVLPALLEALERKEESVRGAAALALGQWTALPDRAWPRLEARLADPSPRVRAAALRCFGRAGRRPQRSSAALLADPSLLVRCAAAWTAGRSRDDRAVEALVACVADDEDEVVRAAAWALGRFPDRADVVVSALGRHAIDGGAARLQAIESLFRISPKQAYALVVRGLDDPNPGHRGLAVRAIANARTDPARAARLLERALGDRDRGVRKAASAVLGRLLSWGRHHDGGDERKQWMTALDILLDPLMDILGAKSQPPAGAYPDRPAAASLIQRFGPYAARIVPRLIPLLPGSRIVHTLYTIGPEAAPATSALARVLNVKFEQLARLAAWSLARIGPAAHAAQPALLHFLADPSIGGAVCSAVQQTGPDPEILLPLAYEYLDRELDQLRPRDDPRAQGRHWFFGEWAAPRPELLPVLIRTRAMRGLRRLGPAASPAVPMLIRELGTCDPKDTGSVSECLAAIGPAARPALNALWRALETAHPDVRKHVEEAIVRLETAAN